MGYDTFDYMRVRDFARLTQMSEGTVRRLARERRLPSVRVGGQWRIVSPAAPVSTSQRGPQPTTGRLR
jgi:excisionase family DNA binding protein